MTAQTDAHFTAHNPHTNGIDLCALAIVHGDLVDMRAALERGKGFRTYDAERKMRAVIAEVDAIKALLEKPQNYSGSWNSGDVSFSATEINITLTDEIRKGKP